MDGSPTTLLAICLGGALTAAAASVSAADIGTFRASVAYDYTSGKYGGTQTIGETYVPFSAAYQMNGLALRLTVPYVRVSGPATIIDGPTGEFAPGPGGTRSGLGDVVLGLELYDLLPTEDAGFHLDAVGKVKFGTADESQGLGTGETDTSARLDARQELGSVDLFGSAGYLWRGSPRTVRLRSVGFGRVGADLRIAEAARAGVSYVYRPAAIAGLRAVQEAAVFIAFAPAAGLSLRPYVLAGLSDSSPSWGGGIELGWRLAVHAGDEP